MSDYSELKRLAEAATPGRNFDRLPMAGGGLKYECTGDDGSLVLKVDHKNDEWGFVGDNGQADEEFFLACAPSAVLALIAENERIKARLCACRDCAGQGEVYSGHDSYQGHFQPPEPDMDVCGTCGGDGVLGPLEDFEVLAAERDQLKAENELAGMRIKELDLLFGRYILAMRSAVIEGEHGKGPAAAMEWIYNSLAGPGELPPEGETDSQVYFDREIVAVDRGMSEIMAFHRARRAAMSQGEQA